MKEPKIALITEDWKNRLSLMQLLTHLHVTEAIHLKVEQIMKVSANKENTAHKLTQVLKECKHEQEMLMKLETF